MNVLFQNRTDMFECHGGDVTQLLKTKLYLEKMGINVDVSNKLTPSLKNYDIVHLFNITSSVGDTYLQFKNAINQNKLIALSPIYWNMDEAEKYGFKHPIFKLKDKIAWNDKINAKIEFFIYKSLKKKIDKTLLIRIKKDVNEVRTEILNNSDVILPNSKTEKELIKSDFELNNANFSIAPNAIDKNLLNYDNTGTLNKNVYKLSEFVLCVGCLDARKNQLSLLKALKNTEIPIVFVGRVPNSRYTKMCKEIANKSQNQVIFTGEMSHDSLGEIYSLAKVHVLPSWYETPGLASMEAALFGCNIVSTNRGSTKEYFKDMAFYCDPLSEISIRESILFALKSRKNEKLKKHILNNYTWDIVARKTLDAYEKTLY